MVRRIAVAAVIAIILSAAGIVLYLTSSDKSSAVQPAPSAPKKPAAETATDTIKPQPGIVTVTYDGSGFAPKEIVVARGSTVNFDNKTEIPMWVASDPHPEHFNYPEFDVIKVNGQYPKPGNDYSFTFDKTGVWTFHNHVMPSDIGKITVQ